MGSSGPSTGPSRTLKATCAPTASTCPASATACSASSSVTSTPARPTAPSTTSPSSASRPRSSDFGHVAIETVLAALLLKFLKQKYDKIPLVLYIFCTDEII